LTSQDRETNQGKEKRSKEETILVWKIRMETIQKSKLYMGLNYSREDTI